MTVDWNEMQKAMFPLKDYEDLSRRWREAFAYPCLLEVYNFTLPKMADYTQQQLGGDTRNRYTEYCSRLVRVFGELHSAGVKDIGDLTARADGRQQFEAFVNQSGIQDKEIIMALTYLVYWFIPIKKYLTSLVRNDSSTIDAIKILRGTGIRTNLDALQLGRTPGERKNLAMQSGLTESMVAEIVNRADFSRMPWASKATISNIIGAGYKSLAELASADPEQLFEAFYRYGDSIGKNLRLGNEIENSYRIAKIMPVILKED